MTKEAYYFSHDANARNDEKILMLRAEHGMEGYGIYWALLEMMFESSDTKLSHDKVKGMAVGYNVPITTLQSVINTAITEGLFVSDDDKFWSESLLRRKGKYLDMKKKKSEAGKKGMAKRWGNKESDNTDITDDNTDITKNNKGKESKGNKIKVNENKEEQDAALQIEDLRQRYSDEQKKALDDYFEMLRHTRQSAKISKNVILKTYQQMDKFPPVCVEYGVKTHADNPAYHSRKENYTLGIIRNTTADEAANKLNGSSGNKKEINWEDL